MTDPIIAAARFITDHLEWLRHTPAIDEALVEIAAAARVVAGIARGPAEQQYLGPCGALLRPRPCCDLHGEHCEPPSELCCHECTEATHDTYPVRHLDGTHCVMETMECPGDVYAPRGGSVGRCRVCGAEVASEDRRAWLDAEIRSRAFRAVHIADAYGLSVDTIRSWATRGLLVPHGTETDKRTGKPVPTYNVGDVLNLAATTAARRAEAQAKRARRKENAA